MHLAAQVDEQVNAVSILILFSQVLCPFYTAQNLYRSDKLKWHPQGLHRLDVKRKTWCTVKNNIFTGNHSQYIGEIRSLPGQCIDGRVLHRFKGRLASVDAQTYNHVTCQWENVVYIGYSILSTQAHEKESKKVVGNSSRDHEINVTGELKKNRRKAEEEVTSEAKRMKWEDNSGDREATSVAVKNSH